MGIWHGQAWGLAPAAVLGFSLLAIILFIVILVLKGYALWYSARRGEKWWFIIFLIVNTLGILELIYLIFVVKKWHTGMPSASSPSSSSSSPSPSSPSENAQG
ncbi:MAG: hypothetical protein KGI45_00825 [Patescibacteria group bacterium]|nr:hypothetical protein [Patescibacteria group bacterium]MDE1940817.1 hypothetical protein [Patescibacteria group bacterium]MDE1966600.1 hypothetical protein [Patescibacteria group bacterium]